MHLPPTPTTPPIWDQRSEIDHKHCSKVVVVEGLKQSEWGLYEATTATAKAMATETVNEE